VTVRWGIAGPGAIAIGFAQGLSQLPDARLVAVGSRSIERAQSFASARGATAHGSYEELAADADVDVVYVATPAASHLDHVLLFLDAGKHVLCEKPFALSEAQGRRMAEAARSRGLFLMEAMWSRFLPAYRTLRSVLADGEIGEPNHLDADFGFRRDLDPSDRLFDPARGGGGLLDLGVYPVQLASMVFGEPSVVRAVGHIGSTGVDEQVAAVLGYPTGAVAVVQAALRANLTLTARLAGTAGAIELPAFMHCPRSLVVSSGAGRREIDCTWEGDGLRFQVEEVHRCLAAGLTESPDMPLAETLSIARTLDAIRAEIGLTFPGEHPDGAATGA
jgi:predicted dehydrogenase